MQKTDKEGNVTKEYIDFVTGLEREDLERFYIGADLYNYEISNDNKRLNNIINKAIEYLKSDYLDITDIWLKDNLLEILKGEDKK